MGTCKWSFPHIKFIDNFIYFSSSIVIGLAMCSFSYTLEGKALLLNDLFVSPSYRSRGIGKLLFNTVLQYAKKTDRKSVDLYVVKWNPARKLYENLGAIDLNSKEDAQLLRVYDKIIQAWDLNIFYCLLWIIITKHVQELFEIKSHFSQNVFFF